MDITNSRSIDLTDKISDDIFDYLCAIYNQSGNSVSYVRHVITSAIYNDPISFFDEWHTRVQSDDEDIQPDFNVPAVCVHTPPYIARVRHIFTIINWFMNVNVAIWRRS